MPAYEVATRLKPNGVNIEGIDCTIGPGGVLYVDTEEGKSVAVYAPGAWFHYRLLHEDEDE